MKRQILLLIALFYAVITYAQIPNNGFEVWDTAGCPYITDSVAVDWTTGCSDAISFISSLTATTDAHQGTYACKLPPAGEGIGGTLGGMYISTSVPVNYLPQYLEGYYKYTVTSSDSAHVVLFFKKFNVQTQQNDTTLVSHYYLFAQSQYTHFALNTGGYVGMTIPDTIDIYIGSSYIDFNRAHFLNHRLTNNGTLYLDEVAFSGTVGIDETSHLSAGIYPNPSSDFINFTQINTEWVSYEILDITGRNVQSGAISKQLDIARIPSGLYTIRVLDKEGNQVATDKLVKN